MSLSGKDRLSRLNQSERSSMEGAASAMALSAHSSGMTGNDRSDATSSGATMPTSTNVDDKDDDMIYVVRKHTITRRAPMETYTELIPYDLLPVESQQNPTEVMTWAKQTPGYLYLETYAPPQCETCLANLSRRSTDTSAYIEQIAAMPVTQVQQEPVIPIAAESIPHLPASAKIVPASAQATEPHATSMMMEREPIASPNPPVITPVAPQPIAAFMTQENLPGSSASETTNNPAFAPRATLSAQQSFKSTTSDTAPALSPPLCLPGSFLW